MAGRRPGRAACGADANLIDCNCHPKRRPWLKAPWRNPRLIRVHVAAGSQLCSPLCKAGQAPCCSVVLSLLIRLGRVSYSPVVELKNRSDHQRQQQLAIALGWVENRGSTRWGAGISRCCRQPAVAPVPSMALACPHHSLLVAHSCTVRAKRSGDTKSVPASNLGHNRPGLGVPQGGSTHFPRHVCLAGAGAAEGRMQAGLASAPGGPAAQQHRDSMRAGDVCPGRQHQHSEAPCGLHASGGKQAVRATLTLRPR